MRYTRYTLLPALALIILSASQLSAQSLLGMRYPTGLTSPATGLSARLGGSGAGLADPYIGMSLNPGNLGAIDQSVYSLTFQVDYVRLYDGDQSANFARFTPRYVGFAFPIGKAGTIGASFQSEASNEYAYVANDTLFNETNDSLFIAQSTTFDKQQSTTSWDIGWGISIIPELQVGLSYQRSYFKNQVSRLNILHSSSVSSTMDSLFYSQGTNVLRGGLMGTIGKLGLGLGITYNFIGDLTAYRTIKRVDSVTTHQNNPYQSFDLHTGANLDSNYTLHLPPEGVFGLSWQFNDSWVVATDFGMTFWKEYWSDAPQLMQSYDLMRNAFYLAGGVEFIPAPNLLSPRYFEIMHYSAGLRYQQLPFNGEEEYSLNLGLGLPLGAVGLVDIVFEGGRRQSSIFPDIHENFMRISLATSGGRKWKQRSNTLY